MNYICLYTIAFVKYKFLWKKGPMKAKVPRDHESHNVALMVELPNQPDKDSVLLLNSSFVK